jgi:hypothetical protein
MFIEPETLAPIKNLENQVHLFIYDVVPHDNPHLFVPMFNLLSYVTPIQYLFKEYLLVKVGNEREEELKLLVLDHLWFVQRDFRLLAERTANEQRKRDVWYSLYEAYIEIEAWTGSEFYACVKEFEPFLES